MRGRAKVTVIIPTYNSVGYVTDAVESVLAQTYSELEVIVVDDGSTDETGEALKKYGAAIDYHYKSNGGVSSARNYGIERATGKYVAFLDADDLWMPEKIEKQVALLEKDQAVGLCYVSTQKVDENLRPLGIIQALEYDDYCEALLLNLNIVSGSCSSAMVRREIIAQTDGFDARFSTYADWELWLRLSLLTKFAPLDLELVKYRVLKGSMSSDPNLSKRDALGVLDKFFSLPNLPERYLKLRNKTVSNQLMIVAGEFLHAGKINESIKCVREAVQLHPQNIIRPLGLPFRFTKRILTD